MVEKVNIIQKPGKVAFGMAILYFFVYMLTTLYLFNQVVRLTEPVVGAFIFWILAFLLVAYRNKRIRSRPKKTKKKKVKKKRKKKR